MRLSPSDGRRFVVSGAIGPVVTCTCAPSDLLAVGPEGWGVGAGGFGSDVEDVLRRISDSTFLFDTAFVSRSAGVEQRAMTHKQLATAKLAHFAPTMTYFTAGSPDFRARMDTSITQRELVDEFAWGRSPSAAAIGILALVEVSRENIAGALICSSVAQGSAILLPGQTTVDPDRRAKYFDLDPLRHHPRFRRGWAWLVGTTLTPTGTDMRWRDVVYRYAGGISNGSTTPSQHCHLVLVDHPPSSWTHHDATEAPWDQLSSEACSSIVRAAPSAFPIHSDPETRVDPKLVCTWAFDPGEIHVSDGR